MNTLTFFGEKLEDSGDANEEVESEDEEDLGEEGVH